MHFLFWWWYFWRCSRSELMLWGTLVPSMQPVAGHLANAYKMVISTPCVLGLQEESYKAGGRFFVATFKPKYVLWLLWLTATELGYSKNKYASVLSRQSANLKAAVRHTWHVDTHVDTLLAQTQTCVLNARTKKKGTSWLLTDRIWYPWLVQQRGDWVQWKTHDT